MCIATHKAIQDFLRVHGIGLSKARNWVDRGYRTLKDVMSQEILTETQRIGVEHVDDFECPIPRSEVSQHAALIRGVLNTIDPRTTITVVGSYRRGLNVTNDIDILIMAPHLYLSNLRKQILYRLIPELFSKGYLKGTLAMGKPEEWKRWLGAASLPDAISPIWRRIDIFLACPEEYGAALWYFTGSKAFNRGIERLADSKGYILDNKGLWVKKDGKEGEKPSKGKRVEGYSEMKIFEILGVRWRSPEERND